MVIIVMERLFRMEIHIANQFPALTGKNNAREYVSIVTRVHRGKVKRKKAS